MAIAAGAHMRAWGSAAAVAGMVLVLAGCATQEERDRQAPQQEMLTASDEPEHRRRARIRLELASGYFEEGKIEVALDELKQVLVADPSYAAAYNLRGLVYMRLNDVRQAEESFRRALALAPRDSDVHHNQGWLQCQTGRYPDAVRSFELALANPTYGGRAKTLMAMGLCQARAGQRAEAERSLSRSYELDAGNPITGFNLANLLYLRGDYNRAQFYIRRLNNSDLSNAETLWLGIKVEQRMNDTVAMQQLGEQLKKRYPQSKEREAFDRKAFDE